MPAHKRSHTHTNTHTSVASLEWLFMFVRTVVSDTDLAWWQPFESLKGLMLIAPTSCGRGADFTSNQDLPCIAAPHGSHHIPERAAGAMPHTGRIWARWEPDEGQIWGEQWSMNMDPCDRKFDLCLHCIFSQALSPCSPSLSLSFSPPGMHRLLLKSLRLHAAQLTSSLCAFHQ